MNSVNTVTFDLAPSGTDLGEFVLRRGRIFRAGSYPDKSFSITPAEMADAVAAFQPVDVDLEHTSTPLDGHLGKLQAVELSADGDELIGSAMLPAWLDKVLKDGQRKVSLTWDRKSKRITGLALVNKPRISDAALFAAFSAGRSSRESLSEKYGHLFGIETGRAEGTSAVFAVSGEMSPEMLRRFLGDDAASYASFSGDKADRRRANLAMTDTGRAILRDEDRAKAATEKVKPITRSEWAYMRSSTAGRAELHSRGMNEHEYHPIK